MLKEIFENEIIPIKDWINASVEKVLESAASSSASSITKINAFIAKINSFVCSIDPIIILILFALLAYKMVNIKFAIIGSILMVLLGLIGMWNNTMITLVIVLIAFFTCIVIGVPIGIIMSTSRLLERIMNPILNTLQTAPAFVYLVPSVMIFGIGSFSGIMVTVIFSFPPIARFTNIGIREVPKELIEVSQAFGLSRIKTLIRVQLPLAKRTIYGGMNQTLMMALSMVVVASMIAVQGLGQVVLQGIGNMNIGMALVGGFGIVILATILDALTQSMNKKKK